MGLTTISGGFQRFFSGMREGRTVSAAPEMSPQVTAANTPAGRQTGVIAVGAAGAVAAVRQPERGSHEEEHHLGELGHRKVGGNALAAPPKWRIRWLA